jgi:hypothetical protein
MSDHANGLSRNPNMCASCSSMADGMEAEGSAKPLEASAGWPEPHPAAPVDGVPIPKLTAAG